MNRHCYITILILLVFAVHSFEANAAPVGQDSLKTVLAGKVSEIRWLEENITSSGALQAAQKDLDMLISDMDRISQQHNAEINENPEIHFLYDEYTSIRQQLESRINDILLQQKKDSISEIMQEKIVSYDSLYHIGLRFSSDKKGDSVAILKQQEAGRWVEVQIMSNGNKDLIQSNTDLQEQLDSLTSLHEQIAALSEKKSTPIGQLLLMIVPLIMSVVAIAMVVKVKIDKAKAMKQAAEAQKQAEENAKKAQEEAKKAQEEAMKAQK